MKIELLITGLNTHITFFHGMSDLRQQIKPPFLSSTSVSAKTTSVCGLRRKNSSTAARPPGKYCSSQLRYARISPPALRHPRFTASYIPASFSMKALTRFSFGYQSCVPSSDLESCTICSTSTPVWSATDSTQSFSHAELRKLGVTIEIFIARTLASFHYSPAFFSRVVLLLDPFVRFSQSTVQGRVWLPLECFLDESVITVSSRNPARRAEIIV